MAGMTDLNEYRAQELARVGLARFGLRDEPLVLRPIRTGRFSTSWYVTVADGPAGGEYVLRVAPPDDAGFLFYEYRMMRQEPALHRLVRRCTPVPVPRIVAFDFSRRMIGRDWLLMDRLPGEPLLEAQRHLPARQVQDVLRDLGRHTAALHGITGRLFGYRGRHRPMEPQPTWADAFEIMWTKLLDDVLATALYDKSLHDLAVALYTRHRAAFAGPFTPRLCHMDLWSENILVAAGRLSGLIDFDRACWAEPGIDLAIAEYCGLTAEAFWQGYGRRPENDDAFLVRRWFYLLYEHQKYIVIHAVRRRDTARARVYVEQCSTMLERFARTGDCSF